MKIQRTDGGLYIHSDIEDLNDDDSFDRAPMITTAHGISIPFEFHSESNSKLFSISADFITDDIPGLKLSFTQKELTGDEEDGFFKNWAQQITKNM